MKHYRGSWPCVSLKPFIRSLLHHYPHLHSHGQQKMNNDQNLGRLISTQVIQLYHIIYSQSDFFKKTSPTRCLLRLGLHDIKPICQWVSVRCVFLFSSIQIHMYIYIYILFVTPKLLLLHLIPEVAACCLPAFFHCLPSPVSPFLTLRQELELLALGLQLQPEASEDLDHQGTKEESFRKCLPFVS